MSDVIGNDISRLDRWEKKIAENIVLIEAASEKIEEETALMQERLENSDKFFNERMNKIEEAISELREFMTQTGAARLRISAEHTLQEGKHHLAEIRQATESFQRLTEESCQQLNQISNTVSENISRAVASLKLEDFQHFTKESTQQIKKTSKVAVERMHRMVRWFRWERLGMALVVAVVVALLTGLFINDEAPWEAHQRVVAERDAGKLLMKAWPKLSMSEQARIEGASTFG